MTARQYDNDTVLHYVSTLLGMLWERGEGKKKGFYLMRSLLGRKHIPHFYYFFFYFKENVKALI